MFWIKSKLGPKALITSQNKFVGILSRGLREGPHMWQNLRESMQRNQPKAIQQIREWTGEVLSRNERSWRNDISLFFKRSPPRKIFPVSFYIYQIMQTFRCHFRVRVISAPVLHTVRLHLLFVRDIWIFLTWDDELHELVAGIFMHLTTNLK